MISVLKESHRYDHQLLKKFNSGAVDAGAKNLTEFASELRWLKFYIQVKTLTDAISCFPIPRLERIVFVFECFSLPPFETAQIANVLLKINVVESLRSG